MFECGDYLGNVEVEYMYSSEKMNQLTEPVELTTFEKMKQRLKSFGILSSRAASKRKHSADCVQSMDSGGDGDEA